MKTGDRNGRLVAKEPIKGGKFWLCDCDCGNQSKTSRWHFDKGLRKSCGCRKEIPPEAYTCTVCRNEKSRNEFYERKNGHVYQTICKPCHKQHMREVSATAQRQSRIDVISYYSNGSMVCACCGESIFEFLTIDHIDGGGNKHRKNERISNLSLWLKRRQFPSGFRILCTNCNFAHGVYGYCPHNGNVERPASTSILRYRKLRIEALKHYGGDPPTCACCGINHIEFLHLDHTNGDGAAHRRQLKTYSIYRWVKAQGYPNMPLRVLCANCNCSIGHYGYCPHILSRPVTNTGLIHGLNHL